MKSLMKLLCLSMTLSSLPSKIYSANPPQTLPSWTTEIIKDLAAKGILVMPPSAESLAAPSASVSGSANDAEHDEDEDDQDVLGGLDMQTETNDSRSPSASDPRLKLYRAPIDPSAITKKYQKIYAALAYRYPKLGHHGRKWLTKQLLEMGYNMSEISFALG
ncbi:hypothetical protein BCR44DRAFT_334063 [Catenaria anguillulae PL171]|uniref:Uncharacterized protein n=1 Tax=Catenaria anguillulae PL171 TaxID=765915 RepID=A0A1Y2HDR3_9FUNG|nr:hypothetical protein BCR44DRAFT_334063 [Catenaria anguillulae PL171]